ncbi:hypothetical protein U1Q18_040875 [Sarracenia purpurea var. burkii]
MEATKNDRPICASVSIGSDEVSNQLGDINGASTERAKHIIGVNTNKSIQIQRRYDLIGLEVWSQEKLDQEPPQLWAKTEM